MTYTVKISSDSDNFTVLRIGFADPAQNDEIVQDAVSAVKALSLEGGTAVALNGPASLPVAVALSHEISHLYETVWVFDPKINSYICSVSHSSKNAVGDTRPA